MHLAETSMENGLLWEVVTLVIGVYCTYTGAKTLFQSDKQYIASLEQKARQNARFDGISEEEAMRKYVDYIKKDVRTWRMYLGGRMFAVGFVLLFAFALLVLLDIGT
jgi:hypothetical protein